jgi:hypothetical protein
MIRTIDLVMVYIIKMIKTIDFVMVNIVWIIDND